MVVADSYFDIGAIDSDAEGTYADPDAMVACGRSYEWRHPLADVVSALAGAGLRTEFLHEYPFASWARLPSVSAATTATGICRKDPVFRCSSRFALGSCSRDADVRRRA